MVASVVQFLGDTAPSDNPPSGSFYLWFDASGALTKRDSAGNDTAIASSGSASEIALTNATELTIATGAVTKTQTYHSIDTEGEAASDDLDTISGGTAGEIIYIFAVNDARTVVVKNGTGNILTWSGSDITLDEDHKIVALIYDGTNWREIGNTAGGAGGGMTSFTLTGDSGTPQTIEDGNTLDVAGGTGIDTVVGATDTVTVSIDSTVATLTGAQTLTNKTINATNNTVTNIGASEVEAGIIADQTVETTVDATNDTLLMYDASALALREVTVSNIRGAGGSGLYTSLAILRDEKATTTNGGSSSATTWNARDLNTEVYDPDAIVTIASNQFTPISGDYEIYAIAPSRNASINRLRLFNVTGASVVDEGMVAESGVDQAQATLVTEFTANGTDAYRIDHYTNDANAGGLGLSVNDGSPEIYLNIVLRKLS